MIKNYRFSRNINHLKKKKRLKKLSSGGTKQTLWQSIDDLPDQFDKYGFLDYADVLELLILSHERDTIIVDNIDYFVGSFSAFRTNRLSIHHRQIVSVHKLTTRFTRLSFKFTFRERGHH